MKFPFDEYDLRARVFPALITSLPGLALFYAAIPAARTTIGAGAGTLLEAAALYFFARLARDSGASLQERLYLQWGGRPTTRLLRHGDASIDSLTKARYKSSLTKSTGVELPTEEAERENPAEADRVYGSAIAALLEQRRGKKDRLIFLENCNYGFARNLLGIRKLGITLATITMIVASLTARIKGTSPALLISLGVSILNLMLLAVYVNSTFVLRSADAYAVALLRSCEPGIPKPKRIPGKTSAPKSST